jgi:hypothetical protein
VSELAGRKFGSWIVAASDDDRTAHVVCICGAYRRLTIATLISGETLGCGMCTGSQFKSKPAPVPRRAFAADLAELEGRSSGKRHREGD